MRVMSRDIALNTIISVGARIIGIALSLLSLGITTRLLGAQGYGLYSTALTWAYLASFIADFGLYSILVREVGRAGPQEEKRIISHLFTLRLVSLLFFFASLLIIAAFFPDLFAVGMLGLALACVQYLFLSLSQVLMGAFQKHLRMGMVAVGEIVGRLLTAVALLYLFYLHPQSTSYELVLVLFNAGAGVLLLLNILNLQRFSPFGLAFDAGYWKHILIQASPLALSIILTTLYFKLDTLFIGYFRGQEEVGLYNVAYRFLENLIAFPAMFVGVLMPQLSHMAISDKEKFKKMFQGAFEVLFIISLPLVIGIFLEAQPLILLFGGEEFAASAGSLQILALAIGMIYFGSLFSSALIALDLQKHLALIYFIGAVFNITANFFIVPRWGFIGAAVTTLLTEALVTILMIQKIESWLTLQLAFRKVGPVLGASLAMAVVLYVTSLPILASVFVGVITYIGTLFLLKGITVQEIRDIMEG